METEKSNIIGRIMWVVACTGAVLAIAPLFLWAFGNRWYFPSLIPSEYHLRAWHALSDPRYQIGSALLNSFCIAMLVTVIDIILAIAVIKILDVLQIVRLWIVDILLIFPLLLPPLTILFGVYSSLSLFNLVNNVFAVITGHVIITLPYMIIIMRGIAAHLDPRFENVAATLGASPVSVAIYITLPMRMPALLVTGLFVFLISWSQYLATLLLGGGRIITLPILLVSYASGGDWSLMAMITLIQLAPTILFLLLSSRLITGRTYSMNELTKI